MVIGAESGIINKTPEKKNKIDYLTIADISGEQEQIQHS